MAARLRITPTCVIGQDELVWRFTASGGPGGQHANRASTRAEVRFDIAGSPSLSERQRALLLERLGPEVRVVADDERSQARNRTLAQERLVARLAGALHVDPPRRATRPSRGSTERRLRDKRQRAERKAARRPPERD